MAKRSILKPTIEALRIKGFKSLAEETRIELRPLTLLAGANSSGKSSALQPFLMLKQTLEASYDPGPLLLHDSHVRFTSPEQFFSRVGGSGSVEDLCVALELSDGRGLEDRFRREGRSVELVSTTYLEDDESLLLDQKVSWKETRERLERFLGLAQLRARVPPERQSADPDLELLQRHTATMIDRALDERRGETSGVVRTRCFLTLGALSATFLRIGKRPSIFLGSQPFDIALRRVIHVPGLRGNPERTYRTTAVGDIYQGTFEAYVASVINSWQTSKNDRLRLVGHWLERLGLTWKVEAKQLDATQAELRVGRLPHARQGGAHDLVNIADVGFGVSQTLPVLVALLVAEPGQLVYLEQPEIHLHPRAQVILADFLVEAANRGVRVVAETHSALLLTAVQALVAEKKIDPSDVKLHWFRRREKDGVTEVISADVDERGAYGPWPEDFGEVTLRTEGRYLDAVESVVGLR